MLTTQDDAIAERLRKLRSHGMTSLTWDRHQGMLFRMMSLTSVLTTVSMKSAQQLGGCSSVSWAQQCPLRADRDRESFAEFA
jgi:hypothetical protein